MNGRAGGARESAQVDEKEQQEIVELAAMPQGAATGDENGLR